NALLALSRSGRRELSATDVDMSGVLGETLDALRRSIDDRGAEVTVAASLPAAHADLTAVGQLWTNLLTNALRYLQPGRPGRIEVGGRRDDGASHYFVKDNGVGMSSTAQKKLFQVFQRFRPDLSEGEGIGLAMVKNALERQGGSIWVE